MIKQLKRVWGKRPIVNGVIWLDADSRYFGYFVIYYDGFDHAFGLWWFAIGWRTADDGLS